MDTRGRRRPIFGLGPRILRKRKREIYLANRPEKNVSVIESMFEDRDNEEWVSFSLASFPKKVKISRTGKVGNGKKCAYEKSHFFGSLDGR